MFRRIVLSLLVIGIGIAAPALADDQAPKTLRVYFVGNSVTDTINYRGLAEIAKSRGYTQVWGRHMIPGAPLQWIWQHPKDGFQEQPFGHYPTALANFQWDVLSLQPFDRHLDGKEGDLAMAKNFIDLADARDEAIVQQIRGNEAVWNSATSEQKAALLQEALLPVDRDAGRFLYGISGRQRPLDFIPEGCQPLAPRSRSAPGVTDHEPNDRSRRDRSADVLRTLRVRFQSWCIVTGGGAALTTG